MPSISCRGKEKTFARKNDSRKVWLETHLDDCVGRPVTRKGRTQDAENPSNLELSVFRYSDCTVNFFSSLQPGGCSCCFTLHISAALFLRWIEKVKRCGQPNSLALGLNPNFSWHSRNFFNACHTAKFIDPFDHNTLTFQISTRTFERHLKYLCKKANH